MVDVDHHLAGALRGTQREYLGWNRAWIEPDVGTSSRALDKR